MRAVHSLCLGIVLFSLTGCLSSVDHVFTPLAGNPPQEIGQASGDVASAADGAGGAAESAVSGGTTGAAGTLVPSHDTIIVATGGSAQLSWTAPASAGALTYTMTSEPAATDQGTITVNPDGTVTYTAPASASSDLTVRITARATDPGIPASTITVRVPATGEIGVVDDGITQGLVGRVYVLPANTQQLPSDSYIDRQTPVQTLVVGTVDIPNRYFTQGIPQIPNLIEWFEISFQGQLIVPAAATYYFQLTADDGANLYIDGQLVVNDDGIHPVQSRSGSVALTAGHHTIRLDYYQGPRYYIACQLFWRTSTSAPWAIVPASALARP